jgi:hypothetical protein
LGLHCTKKENISLLMKRHTSNSTFERKNGLGRTSKSGPPKNGTRNIERVLGIPATWCGPRKKYTHKEKGTGPAKKLPGLSLYGGKRGALIIKYR